MTIVLPIDLVMVYRSRTKNRVKSSLNFERNKLVLDQILKIKKSSKKRQNAFEHLKAGPPQAILVIFGRRALIFFVWKLLEKMKNDTTFVRMLSGDHLGDAKMSKKGTSLRRI